MTLTKMHLVAAMLFTVGSTAAADQFITLAADPRLALIPGPRTVVMVARREPYLFCSSKGTLFVQAAVDGKPLDVRDRKLDGFRVGSAISRDGGKTWTPWTLENKHDDVDIEGE